MEGVGFYIVESPESPTSKVDILRGIITEKLTTAVQEIFAVVEATIAGYDKEVLMLRHELEYHKRQLEATLRPDICPSTAEVNYEGDEVEDSENDHENPTLKQENEGAVEAVIPSDDDSPSSVYSPMNTDDDQDDTMNDVQEVKRKKRRRHTNHTDTDPSEEAFGQQCQDQATTECEQSPGDAVCSGTSAALFRKITEQSDHMDITIQMGKSLPEIKRCTDCCRDFHCPFCDPNHFYPTNPWKVKTHLKTHFNRSINHEEFTIHRCGRSCRTDLHYHCLYCKSTVLRKEHFIKHLQHCRLETLRRHQLF